MTDPFVSPEGKEQRVILWKYIFKGCSLVSKVLDILLSPNSLFYLMPHTYMMSHIHMRASQVALGTKNLPANAGDTGDPGSIPGSRRSPWVGNGDSLQYSCLENPVNREAWWAMVHRVTESQTQLSEWAHMRVYDFHINVFQNCLY